MRRSGTSVDRRGEVELQLRGDRTKSGVTDHDKQPASAITSGPGSYLKWTVTEKVLDFVPQGPPFHLPSARSYKRFAARNAPIKPLLPIPPMRSRRVHQRLIVRRQAGPPDRDAADPVVSIRRERVAALLVAEHEDDVRRRASALFLTNRQRLHA